MKCTCFQVAVYSLQANYYPQTKFVDMSRYQLHLKIWDSVHRPQHKKANKRLFNKKERVIQLLCVD